jgi:hypothetical protein
MTLAELSYAQIEQALQALPEPLPHHARNSSRDSIGSNSFLFTGGYPGYAAVQGGYHQEHEVEIKHEQPAVLSALLQQSLLTLAMHPQRRAMAEQEHQANSAHSPRGTDLDLHEDDYSEPGSPHYGQEQQQEQQQQHFHFQQQHVQQQPQRELQWPEVACPMPLPTSYEYLSKKRSLSSVTAGSLLEGALELPYAGQQQQHQQQQQQNVKQPRSYTDDAATSRTVGRKVCTFPGCPSAARGSGLCKRHGGGKRCSALMCRSSARSGSEFCTSHGGGRRCTVEGCKKGAEGSSFLCVTHGGGKRCNFEGCTKKDQGRGFCKGHGGGRRCQSAGCEKTVKTGSQLCGLHMGTYNLLGALIQRAGAN